MKEHKKLYKAGKLWVTATLFAFAGVVLAASPAAADDTVSAAPQASTAVTTDNGQAATVNTESVTGSQATLPIQSTTPLSGNQLTEAKLAMPAFYSFQGKTVVSGYAGQFSMDTYDLKSVQVKLDDGSLYNPVAGDLGLFDSQGNIEYGTPTVAGSYRINLTPTGLEHINAINSDQQYSFQSYSGISVDLEEAKELKIKTEFTDSSKNHEYTYDGLPVPTLQPGSVVVKVMDKYGLDQVATYHPVAGDLEYVDDQGKAVESWQVGTDGNFANGAVEKLYGVYLSPQGVNNLKSQFSFIKSIAELKPFDTVDLANVVVRAPQKQKGLIFLKGDTTKTYGVLGKNVTINLQNYTLKYFVNGAWEVMPLQDGDLAFYDHNGYLTIPTKPGMYEVNATSQLLQRLNNTPKSDSYFEFDKQGGAPYNVLGESTSALTGPAKISLNDVRQLDTKGYTITVSYQGTPVYTYHPVAGDLEIVDQAGNVVNNPQAAGNYQVRLSKLGILNMQSDKALTYYVLQPDVATTVNLYQPYVPTAQDYKQNFGSLDGHSIRQVSDSEAALHVAGWHASGASAVMPNGWLIVFDNTLGHEIKRVQIKPVNRPDVQAAYQNVYGSLQSGFDQDILIPLANAGDDLTIIARYSSDAVSGEGQRIDHWFDRMNVDHGNHAYVDSVQFANGQLHVAGWHATNAALGKPYHSIIVWDATQGRELERANNVTVNRPDIPGVYPTIVMADHSGFSADLKLLPEMANDQIQFISRYSTDEAGNQDYVDYWFGPQQLLADHRNQAYLDNINVQNGKLHIAGWHVTNQSTGRPYHSIIVLNANTGRELGRYTSSQPVSRPDLTRVFPGVITAVQNGFSGDIALTAGMGDQPIRIISRWSATADANSNYVDYWFAPQQLYPDLSNRAALDGFTAQGAVISAAGWHATTQSLGRGHHYVILFDQTANREVQRREVTDNNNRPDVAQAFPGVYNADHAGFNVQFTVDSSVNGHRLVILSRWTNDPAGNGNAVDYWFGNQPINPEAPVIPAGGVNLPDNHNVKKAFHIDSIKPVIDEYVDPETKQPKSMKILDVTGWMISNYCANWNYKSLRDQIMMHHDWEHARCEQIIFQVNGQDVDNVLMMAEGWNNAMDMERPDVAAAYPDVWNSLNSGFQNGFRMFRDIKPTDECRFVFRYYANGGNWKVYDQMVSPIYHFDASTWEHAEIVKD